MREAERREQAALDYAKGVEEKRQILEKRFEKTDSEYVKKFETSISSGLEAAQKELASAIEAGDAQAQVEANKRIATLAFENAKLEQAKAGREEQQAEKPVLSQPPVQTQQMDDPINPDPKAEAWASQNSWFGTDKAMTYTAFEIHKDLTEKKVMILTQMSIMQRSIEELKLTFRINLVLLIISKRPLLFRQLLLLQEA